jgi:hypothetical protein
MEWENENTYKRHEESRVRVVKCGEGKLQGEKERSRAESVVNNLECFVFKDLAADGLVIALGYGRVGEGVTISRNLATVRLKGRG